MHMAVVFAIFAAAFVPRPGHAAPAADAQWAAMAANLFPAIEAIQPDQLPADVKKMLATRRSRIKACQDDLRCSVEKSRWTDGEVNLLAGAAERAIATGRGPYKAPDDGVRSDVARQLAGLNNILNVYGLGMPARYPEIDGPATIPGSTPESLANVRHAFDLAEAGRSDPATALDPSVGLAISLLDANNRNEPAAFEPLDAKFNSEALAKARAVDWTRYRFSAIIAPGIGPDDLTTPLSARSKLSVRMAAERFADGIAPFIIVSGANVHPRGSRMVEAVQMRQALIERLAVPADSVVIEPYARHTTTNLRNVTRRLISLGAPLSKDALIITDQDQSHYIESSQFFERNQAELGYQPGKIGPRHSPTELTFRPSISSMRIDPMDPLDP
jgi:hypothetical protein